MPSEANSDFKHTLLFSVGPTVEGVIWRVGLGTPLRPNRADYRIVFSNSSSPKDFPISSASTTLQISRKLSRNL